MPAFEAAAAEGFPIELDVRRTADGIAVVFHDRTLRRFTGCDIPVSECSWQDLQTIRIGAAGIPRLEEVLECVAGRVPVLIEIKVERFTGAEEAAVARALRGRREGLAIQSFHPLTVFWFSRRYPEIPRGQISCSYDTDPRPRWQTRPLASYAFNWLTRPHFLADHLARLPHPRVATLRKRFPLLVWTVRSPAEAAQAKALADNYIFEGFVPT